MINWQAVQSTIIRNTIPVPFCGCWVWTGYIARDYPVIRLGGKNSPAMAAHKATFLAFNGPVPSGKVIRHTCDVASCCNPEHLIVGTTRDNIMDCVSRGRHRNQNTGRQVCKNGHALTADNVRLEGTGLRRCLECQRRYQAEWRKRNRRESA